MRRSIWAGACLLAGCSGSPDGLFQSELAAGTGGEASTTGTGGMPATGGAMPAGSGGHAASTGGRIAVQETGGTAAVGSGGAVSTGGAAPVADAGMGSGGVSPDGLPPCGATQIECQGVCVLTTAAGCGSGGDSAGGTTGTGGDTTGGAPPMRECFHSGVLTPSTGCLSLDARPCPAGPVGSVGEVCNNRDANGCYSCGFACMNGYHPATDGSWSCVQG